MGSQCNALRQATEKSLEMAQERLKEAEDVASSAQDHWVTAEAAAQELRDEVVTVRAALDILLGKAPEAISRAQQEVEPVIDEPPAEESADDFEKRLGRERRAKKKALYENGPYAGLQCGGCGTVGSLYDGTQSMGTRMIPVIACHECSSVKRR